MSLKTVKGTFNIRLAFEQINPCKATEIIEETNIAAETANGYTGWTPDIGVNELNWSCGYM
jgi:hypothetical protein